MLFCCCHFQFADVIVSYDGLYWIDENISEKMNEMKVSNYSEKKRESKESQGSLEYPVYWFVFLTHIHTGKAKSLKADSYTYII